MAGSRGRGRCLALGLELILDLEDLFFLQRAQEAALYQDLPQLAMSPLLALLSEGLHQLVSRHQLVMKRDVAEELIVSLLHSARLFRRVGLVNL